LAQTDATVAALWGQAHKRFDTMMKGALTAADDIDDGDVARRVGILEAASVIEDMRNRAERSPNPAPELISLLNVMIEQVLSLLVLEGGEK
jgi:hypothetical protein